MTPLEDRHQLALSARTAFRRIVQGTITRGEESHSMRVIEGTIENDARRAMRWSGEIICEVPAALLPVDPGDLYTNFGSRVTLRCGVQLSDESISTRAYGTFVVEQSFANESAEENVVQLNLIDLAQLVAQYRFEQPFEVSAGTDIAAMVNNVISDRTGQSPGLDTTGVTLARSRIFGLDPEEDPWRELQDAVRSFGYRLWYNRQGALVMDQPPDPSTLPVTIQGGGVSLSTEFETRPPNIVVARGEPDDDSPPVHGIAMDEDPNSPTYAGTAPGTTPYGRVTRYYASNLLSSNSEAQQAARSILLSYGGGGAGRQITRLWDPSWDPDDLYNVPARDRTVTVQVDAVVLDLTGVTTGVVRAPTGLEG